MMKELSLLRVCSKHRWLLEKSRLFSNAPPKPPAIAPAVGVSKSESILTAPSVQQTQVSRSVDFSDRDVISSESTDSFDSKITEEKTIPDLIHPTEDTSAARIISYDGRRVDPTTVKEIFFFDTLAMVKTLQTNGFTREQAEGMTQSLVEVINSTLEHQMRHMITKMQQEITVQQLMSEIASVKKDMVLLQKSEFSSLRNQTEKQSFEIRQIKDSLRDEIAKLKGQMTLDINLERSRSVEAHAANQKEVQNLNNKIETQVAHLRTTYEQYRNDVFKYAGGTVLTCAGICLGIMRMWN